MSMEAVATMARRATTSELRFLGVPTWIKGSRAGTGGHFSLIEQVIPPGFESPWHVHNSEDESFYLIEGEMTVIAGDTHIRLGAGDFAFGPRGVPHGFRVEGSAPARLLLMTTGADFADFIEEMSEPADATPMPPDLGAIGAAAERHNLRILGPMPR